MMRIPLLSAHHVDSAPAYTVDAFLALGRFGAKKDIPSWPTLRPALLLGSTAYSMPAMLILAPTFFDDRLRAEWFADQTVEEGKWALTLVSMGFFLLWGLGMLVTGAISDRHGRKFGVYVSAVAIVVLSGGCAVAPSFGVYAACRALLGAPVGAIGGVVWLLCVEWALPADNAMLASALMVLWSLTAVALAGLMAATDALGWPWRVQLGAIALLNATPLLCLPLLAESPRILVAHGHVEAAEAALRDACRRSGIAVPEGSTLAPEHAPAASRAAGCADGDAAGRADADADAVAVSLPPEGADVDDAGAPAPAPSSSFRVLFSPALLGRVVLVSFLWVATSLLFYGLDFAVAGDGADGGSRYVHAAFTSAVDVPGYLVGGLLANTRLGRRLTAALALALGGGCLLATAAASAWLPARGAHGLGEGLKLLGKLCSSAGFVQAYLFPAELFPTAVRGAAFGVGNLASRLGTIAAPLAATAPPRVVQLSLGTLSVLAGGTTLLLPERRGLALPD